MSGESGQTIRVAIAGCGAISRAHLKAIAEARPGDGVGVTVSGRLRSGRGAGRRARPGVRRRAHLRLMGRGAGRRRGGRRRRAAAPRPARPLRHRGPRRRPPRGGGEADGHLDRRLRRHDRRARRAGKRLHPVHNRVYDPASEAAQAFLAEGAIGEVFLAQTVGLEPPQTVSVRPWLGTPAGGGGVLLAQAVHPAYVLRWLLGDVDSRRLHHHGPQRGRDDRRGHRRRPAALPLRGGRRDDRDVRAARRPLRARHHPLRPGGVRGDPQPAGRDRDLPPALRRPHAAPAAGGPRMGQRLPPALGGLRPGLRHRRPHPGDGRGRQAGRRDHPRRVPRGARRKTVSLPLEA